MRLAACSACRPPCSIVHARKQAELGGVLSQQPVSACVGAGFYFGREVGPTDPDWGLPLHGPNQWPPAQLLPRYKDVAQAYYDALNALGFRQAPRPK